MPACPLSCGFFWASASQLAFQLALVLAAALDLENAQLEEHAADLVLEGQTPLPARPWHFILQQLDCWWRQQCNAWGAS